MSSIVPYQSENIITGEKWLALKEQAQIIAQSGLAPASFKTPQQVIAASLVAIDLGLSPAVVLQGGLYVVGGVVSCNSRLMMAMIMRSKEIKINIEKTDDAVRVTMERPSVGLSYTAVWDEKRVAESQANIDPKTKKEKWPWKFHRQTMKLWRAIAEAARVVAPDIIGGMYIPDELNLPTSVEGEDVVIDHDAIDAEARVLPEEKRQEKQVPEQKQESAPAYKSTPRPWPADIVIDALQDAAQWAHDNGRTAQANGVFGACLGILDKLGDHHVFLERVFAVRSTNDLDGHQRYALMAWMKPEKDDESGEWIPGQHVRDEVMAVMGIGSDEQAPIEADVVGEPA